MRSTTEIRHDGPYVRIVLPDYLPPDWETLRRDVESECDEPVTRATIVSPRVDSDSDVQELQGLVRRLERSGAAVFLVDDR